MNQQIPYLLLAAGALAWILCRQFSAKPVRESRPNLLMLILDVVGLGQVAVLAGRGRAHRGGGGRLAPPS